MEEAAFISTNLLPDSTGRGSWVHPFRATATYPLSHFREVDDDFAESDNDSSLLTAVRDTLQRKNNKLTNIIFDRDEYGYPSRFCYHDETEEFQPNLEEYSSVLYIEFLPLFGSCTSVWQGLNENAQDNLYSLLWSARRIFCRVIFDYKRDLWVSRSSPPRPEDRVSHMHHYGYKVDDHGEIQTGPDVMKYLGRGRSPQQIQESLKNIQSILGHHTIEDVWQLALTAGMTDGLGHTAVYFLLDHIAGLIHGLDAGEVFNNAVPKIAILSVTSATASDGVSIASSPLSAQTSSSSASVSTPTTSSQTSPPAKRKKVMKPATGGSGDASLKRASSAGQMESWPCNNRQCVDMSVVCMDGTSGIAKYLLLVKIHSRGTSYFMAMKKFLSEIIYSLQGQNVVFGLFFRMKEVILITARKEDDGSIYISEQSYKLRDVTKTFNVEKFQVLIMDIFACLVFGIKCIAA